MNQALTPDVPAALRLALRRLAKAVVVITARNDGQRNAMTATAVNELSLDPPSMPICVNQSASMYAALAAGVDFCINILHESQSSIAATCAGRERGEARFVTGDWAESATGVPWLRTAQASIICKNDDARLVYGTHGVFIGQVSEVYCKDAVRPLIYADGKYAGLGEAF